jgi:DNA-binding response OmpR family regulator
MNANTRASRGARRLLVVDDDEAIQKLITIVFLRHGMVVDSARDGEAALELLARREYDAIVLDLMMPRKNGFEVIDVIRRERPDLLRRTIVLTAASNRTLQDVNVERLVRRLIRKPFDLSELVDAVLACRRPSTRRSTRASVEIEDAP